MVKVDTQITIVIDGEHVEVLRKLVNLADRELRNHDGGVHSYPMGYGAEDIKQIRLLVSELFG